MNSKCTLLALLLVACQTTASQPAVVADSAYLEITTFLGDSYRVNITGTKVLYQTQPQVAADWEEIKLPAAQAKKYFLGLRSLGIFSWREKYYCPAMDGTDWRLEVIEGGEYFRSEGSNAFPPRFGELLKLTTEIIGRPVTARTTDRDCTERQK